MGSFLVSDSMSVRLVSRFFGIRRQRVVYEKEFNGRVEYHMQRCIGVLYRDVLLGVDHKGFFSSLFHSEVFEAADLPCKQIPFVKVENNFLLEPL